MSDKNFKNPWDDNDKQDDVEKIFKNSQEKIVKLINKKKSHKDGGGPNDFNFDFDFLNYKKYLMLIGIALLLVWLSTGFYTIQPYEEGLVLTFGKYSRTALPGLNYKLPDPFEVVEIASVTSINKEEVGFRSSGKKITSRDQLLENTISNESQMLTTDENIIDVNFEVQWKVNDIKKFLFNVYDNPDENTIKSVAETAMREVIGLAKISDVLAKEKDKIGQNVRSLMQSILDSYDRGVTVIGVQLRRIEPPQEVIDAYRDVQNAKQDKEREINRAYAYSNDILPRARGEAEQIIQQSQGYKSRVTAEASGDSQRFNSVYEQYKTAKDVTRKRMYLEMMEKILAGMDKIIIDKSASNMVPYLPLNEFNKPKQPKE